MSGRVDFAMHFGANANRRKPSTGNSGRLYIFGDFSGAAGSDSAQPAFTRIDRDNFEAVMAKLQPALAMPSGVRLQFTGLDDFHPDVWLPKVKLLADLLVLKQQLQNPATAAQAAANIKAFLPASVPEQVAESRPAAEKDDEMWLRLLGKAPDDMEQPDSVNQWLKQTLSPHIVQPVPARHQDLLQAADLLLGQFTRTILHDTGFQRLEALWRATLALLREERAEQYNVFLLDMGKPALQQVLAAGSTALAEHLLQHIASADGEADIVLIADVTFSAVAEDAELLAYWRDLARRSGGRFLAGVDAGFCQSLRDDSAQNPLIDENLLLAYPRYLSRLPYGPKTDPIDRFDFAECAEQPSSADLLWTNAAFLVARRLLREEADGAGFFTDVPVFSYTQNGEAHLQPGTETVLNEAQANALLASGIVPVVGFHQQQGVRVLL